MKAVVLLFDKRRGRNKTSKSSGCGKICSVNIKQQPSPPLSPPLLRGISLKGARCNSGLRRIPSFYLRRSRPRKPQGSFLRRPFKTERRWRWRSQGSERRGEVRKEKKVPLLNCRGAKKNPPLRVKESKRPKRRPLPNEDGKKKEFLANPLSCTLQLRRQRRLQKGVHWKGKDIWIPVRLTFFRAREGERPPSGIANPPSLLQLPTTPDPPSARQGRGSRPSFSRSNKTK